MQGSVCYAQLLANHGRFPEDLQSQIATTCINTITYVDSFKEIASQQSERHRQAKAIADQDEQEFKYLLEQAHIALTNLESLINIEQPSGLPLQDNVSHSASIMSSKKGESTESKQVFDLGQEHAERTTADPPQRKSKRSTERGEGRAKIIAALTKHHQYADSGCLNHEPIGNNKLATAAGVSVSTASTFFKDKFQGHTQYRTLCRDAGRLVAALKLLNDEFAPYHLLGAAVSDLASPDQDDADLE